jgi:hypothetical protein
MPSLGGWEWIILGGIVLLAIPVLIVVLVVWAVRRSRTQAPQQAVTFYGQPPAVDSRLAEADRLLQSGQISQEEHQAMRSRILGIS